MIKFQQNFEAASRILRNKGKEDMILFVLRHGESLGQKNPNAYGALGDDVLPITRLGVRQSIASGKLMSRVCILAGIDRVEIRTSTGERSGMTGELIYEIMSTTLLHTGLREDPRLDKQKFGAFDGYFTSAARKQHAPEAYLQYETFEKPKGDFHARPPGGESIADVQARIADVVSEINEHPVPTVLVTHGTNALCVENLLLGRGEDWVLASQDQRPNCSIHMIFGKPGNMQHLPVADDPLGWSKNNPVWSPII